MSRVVFAALILAAAASPAFSAYGVENAFPNLPLFTEPIDVEDPMDGTDRLFVIEKEGRIRVFQNDPSVSSAGTFLTLVDSVTNIWESGLLGLTFHPNYENNGYFYVIYVSKAPMRTILARYSVSGNPDVADPTSHFRLLEIPQINLYHKGGGLVFGPDGYLYVSLGEDGQINDSQNLSSLKGKLLRLDVDSPSGGLNYGIPPDNPFAGNLQGWREEIWAFGFRNPWRFSIDPMTGRLWLGDVGLDTYEEIDLVKKGRNYGWPRLEGTMCAYPPVCDTTGLNIDLPLHQYPHTSPWGAAVMGGHVYHGTRTPSLVGMYIFTDHSSGEMWGLEYDGVNPPFRRFLYAAPNPQIFRIADFCVDKDNELFFSSYINGRIHQLTEILTAVGAPPPGAAGMVSVHPNPFAGETRIRYASPGRASLEIFDVQGRFVRRLVDRSAGNGEVAWDGRDHSGQPTASGVYFARLAIEGKVVASRRVVLLK